MSWLFGVAGTISAQDKKKIETVHQHTDIKLYNGLYYVAIGGVNQLMNFGNIQQDSQITNFAVTGIGIDWKDAQPYILNSSEWQSLLSDSFHSISKLDGHFAGVIFDENNLTIFNDNLGIKEIYLASYNGRIFFSTRIDWVAKFIPDATLDMSVISSAWLMENQISTRSNVKNINRLKNSTRVEISRNETSNLSISVQTKEPLYTTQPNLNDNELCTHLAKIQDIHYSNFSKGLLLSGGIDSRFVLANHKLHNDEKIDCFTIGDSDNPDVKVAQRIANELKYLHLQIYDTDKKADEYIHYINDFSALTQLFEPISKIHNKLFYRFLHAKKNMIIDSSGGELLRRTYYQQFMLHSQSIMMTRNEKLILKELKDEKCDIFTNELSRVMAESAQSQILESFRSMPNQDEYGYENWLDLYALRTRIANRQSFDQNRADHYSINIKPFLQNSVINMIFRLALDSKRNATLMKKKIKILNKLNSYYLIRDGVSLPFNLNENLKYYLKKFKKKLGLNYKDKTALKFHKIMQEYSADITDCIEYNNCDYYDKNKTNAIRKGFLDNNKNVNEYDWLLSFEIFRRNIEEDKVKLDVFDVNVKQ